MLEEGSLPIRQAFDDEAALEEERRLLYVGITRARVHLALSWAERRDARGGATGRGGGLRRPSRFLAGLGRGSVDRGSTVGPPAGSGSADPHGRLRSRDREEDSPVMTALRDWRRRRAADDGVPAYVVAHDATLRAIAEARPDDAHGSQPREGHGPDEARALRGRDPGGDRLGDVKRPRTSPGASVVQARKRQGTIVLSVGPLSATLSTSAVLSLNFGPYMFFRPL